MVAEIVSIITTLVTGVFSVVVSGAISLSTVFYDGESMTFIGVVVFIGLAIFLLTFIMRWIVSLIRR
jgi:hypothetical protein